MHRNIFSHSFRLSLIFTVVAFVLMPLWLPAQARQAGLASGDVVKAANVAAPSGLVAMAPQSNLKLLSRATRLGPHAADSEIGLTLALKLRNESGLRHFLEQTRNPYSFMYRRWLTPAEFTRLYGPTKSDVTRVLAFLKTQGIAVRDVSSNRMLIHTRARTAVYEHAFGIMISDFELEGRRFYSTSDSPKLPRAIAQLVVNVLGLNRGTEAHPYSHRLPIVVAHGLGPRDTQQAPPASLTSLNPLQIAHAYNYPDITNVANGSGVNVAILTASSSGLADLSDPHDFWAAYGLPDHTINVIPVGDGNGDASGMGETLLDIEYGGAMGPGAVLNVYVAADPSFAAMTDMYNQFANDTDSNGLARNQVMTTSWGAAEPNWGNAAVTADQIFMQAAAEGISMFAAAGDHGSGDATGQDNVADYPSSSLYVAAANGTQLNISDLNGTYGSEVVWNDTDCYGTGGMATGGAVSQLFGKPGWQRGPGVPTATDMRMNSDMAATASCSKPMLTLSSGRWYLTWGTSAVAPQFAGLFAMAVVRNGGESLGQANELLYEVANAHYASDFHDVVLGNNGAFNAGPNWDHPTGWGSPNVGNLLAHIGIQGPKGTLAGVVTAQSNGSVIAGAIVVATGPGTSANVFQATTGADGGYSRMLPAGSYNVRVSDFGYNDGTAPVSIADGQIATQNFSLTELPRGTLSGKVTDASGHGYGLLANIQISTEGVGQVAAVWTDPRDGSYAVKLPQGATYTLNVAAAFNGYNTASANLTLSGQKRVQNFPLAVTDACTAPGYSFSDGGFGEDFSGGSFPPAGWTVTNPVDGKVVWKLSSQQPKDNGNYTGGTGDAAAADSNDNNHGGLPYDTSLVTPPISVASLHGASVLKYKANFQIQSGADALDLGISADGGESWTRILHWTESHGLLLIPVADDVQKDIGQYLPSTGDFQLRWRYYNPLGGWDWYAQIDDVTIGGCTPLPGGIIYGVVSNSGTGTGIAGATVTDDTGISVTTISNAFDPTLPNGFYMYFAQKGMRTLTAAKPLYTPETKQLTLNDNAIAEQNFLLKSPQFETVPGALTMHVKAGGSATASFALKNTGDGTGEFHIGAVLSPPPPLSESAATGPFAPMSNYAPGTNLAAMTAEGKPVANGASVLHATLDPRVAGDVVASFPTGMPIYGLGGDHDRDSAWLGSPSAGGLGGDDKDHRFLLNGTDTGDAIDVANNSVIYMADMAYDDNTATFWQTSVDMPDGATGHIYEFDPVTMQPTGNGILIPSPQSERGLAYDPLTDTWYAGDFGSRTVYHFNRAGTLLDSANVGLNITGLAYNSATGHLFVLTNNDPSNHPVYVLDAKNGYAVLSWFDIAGFDSSHTGAGLGYDCQGNLIASDFADEAVYLVLSGEQGWCDFKGNPWLSIEPGQGTLTAGASTRIVLTLDGSKQEQFTTSQAYLRVMGATNATIVPVTVTWDAQPVNLNVIGTVSPQGSVHKGDAISYVITVQNLKDASGSATGVQLSYEMPAGVDYLAANGAQCGAPSGNGSGTVPAAVSGPATIVCGLGSLAPDSAGLVTISVQATADAKAIVGTFTAIAREPDTGSGSNTLTLSTDPSVDPGSDSGGGAFGWPMLALFFGFMADIWLIRGVRRKT